MVPGPTRFALLVIAVLGRVGTDLGEVVGVAADFKQDRTRRAVRSTAFRHGLEVVRVPLELRHC